MTSLVENSIICVASKFERIRINGMRKVTLSSQCFDKFEFNDLFDLKKKFLCYLNKNLKNNQMKLIEV